MPEVVRSLRELRLLDLRANRLKSVPDWIVELPRLEKLDLRWNEVFDPPSGLIERGLRGAHRIGWRAWLNGSTSSTPRGRTSPRR